MINPDVACMEYTYLQHPTVLYMLLLHMACHVSKYSNPKWKYNIPKQRNNRSTITPEKEKEQTITPPINNTTTKKPKKTIQYQWVHHWGRVPRRGSLETQQKSHKWIEIENLESTLRRVKEKDTQVHQHNNVQIRHF